MRFGSDVTNYWREGGLSGSSTWQATSQFALILHWDVHSNLQFECQTSIVSGISALKEISKYAQA
jgi:hypothetical protein